MKEQQKKTPKGFEKLDGLCGAYRDARSAVSDRVRLLKKREFKYTHRLIPGLKKRIAAQAQARNAISSYLADHPEQFDKPRTRTLGGIRVGWRKMPGVVVIPDPKRTVDLIRKKLSKDQQKALLVVRTTITKAALRSLSTAELASVGVSIVSVADRPVITQPGDGIDKMAAAFLADHEEDE